MALGCRLAWRGAVLSGLGAWLAVATTSSVRAAEGPRVSWSAPPECPGEAALRERVTASLHEPLESFDPTTSFAVRIRRIDRSFRLSLTIERGSEQGLRELSDRDCNALTSAAAVAIALALRAAKADQEPSPPATPAEQQSEAEQRAIVSPLTARHERTGVQASPRSSRAPGSASSAPVGLGIALFAVADHGTLPALAPGFEVGPTLGWNVVSLGLRLGALTPQDTDAPRGGTFWLGLLELEACARPLVRRPAFMSTCLFAETGQLSGRGRGVSSSITDSALWFAPGARVTNGVKMGQSGLWILIGTSVRLAVTRPDFVLNGREPVYRPEAVVGRFEVGILKELR